MPDARITVIFWPVKAIHIPANDVSTKHSPCLRHTFLGDAH